MNTQYKTTLQRRYNEGEEISTPAPEPVSQPSGDAFTQEDLNRFLAEDRRKNEKRFKKQIEDLQSQMINMKENQSVEAQQEFETQLESMRQQFLTKEQKLQEKLKQEESARKAEINSLQEDRDIWKGMYAETRITTELQSAATGGKIKPVNPNVVVDLLIPKTTLEPVIGDDGSPTGELAPKVSMMSEQDGKPVQLSLSPAEAIERMAADTAKYGSLFASNQSGGLTTGSVSRRSVSSQEDYEAMRASGQHRTIGAS